MTTIPMRKRVRSRLSIVVVASVCVSAALALSGCGGGKHSAGSSEAPVTTSKRAAVSPLPTLSRTVAPAAAAGGICKKLDYDQIHRQVGLQFSVAALHSSKSGSTTIETCTVRDTELPLPDLALTFAPGKLDTKAFDEQFQPQGAQKVAGLGKDAYSIVRDPQASMGSAVEIGWFDDSGSYTLVVTQPVNSSPKTASAMLPKVIDLGKQLSAQK